jgi:HD superfamily phosphohydrolase YqeK
MHIDRDRAAHAFERYVERFDPQDPKIALKVEHTRRVADLAEKIARSLPEGASPEYVDLAWLLGLLHDVGRFEQVRRLWHVQRRRLYQPRGAWRARAV